MQLRRRFFSSLRDHYEKALLVLVLLLLTATVGWMMRLKEIETKRLAAILAENQPRVRAGARHRNADWTPHFAALNNATNAVRLDFGLPHHLFNPVRWTAGKSKLSERKAE